MTLSADLARLAESMHPLRRDASTGATLRTLDRRAAGLCALRDGLVKVHVLTADRRLQRLFVPDAPLADYLRGVFAWAHAVASALAEWTSSLRASRHDWALLRWHLEEAKHFHFDELHEAIRADLATLTAVAEGGGFGALPPAVSELTYAVERLFATAVALEDRLDERFD